jgi:hypothetical protein
MIRMLRDPLPRVCAALAAFLVLSSCESLSRQDDALPPYLYVSDRRADRLVFSTNPDVQTRARSCPVAVGFEDWSGPAHIFREFPVRVDVAAADLSGAAIIRAVLRGAWEITDTSPATATVETRLSTGVGGLSPGRYTFVEARWPIERGRTFRQLTFTVQAAKEGERREGQGFLMNVRAWDGAGQATPPIAMVGLFPAESCRAAEPG